MVLGACRGLLLWLWGILDFSGLGESTRKGLLEVEGPCCGIGADPDVQGRLFEGEVLCEGPWGEP